MPRKPCVYCGKPNADTRDHLPQKGLFTEPRPVDTITVPACSECNRKFKKDEDYLLALFTFGPAATTPVVQELWRQKLHRMYTKDGGIRRTIASALQLIDVRASAGDYLGKRFGVRTDWPRIGRVIEKLVRGFFYVEFGRSMAPEITVESQPITNLSEASKLAAFRQGKRIWPGTFEYRLSSITGDEENAMWIFVFYGTYVHLAVSFNQDALMRHAKRSGRNSEQL